MRTVRYGQEGRQEANEMDHIISNRYTINSLIYKGAVEEDVVCLFNIQWPTAM